MILRRLVLVLLLATLTLAATPLHAQAPATSTPGAADPAPPPPPPDTPAPGAESALTPSDPCDSWRRDPLFRLGQDYVIGPDDVVDSAVAVSGDVLVQGHVCRDLSVTFGDVRLARGATVRDTLVVVGGRVTVEPEARVDGELVLVGGRLDAPAGFRAGRGHVVIGVPLFDEQVRSLSPYLTRGLLLGRLIVPSLPWVWAVVLSVLFLQLVVNLLFPQATWAAASAIVERPLSTFAAGLLVLVLSGPVVLLLTVTVVGIAALPVLVAALAAAWIVGKIAVARWIGVSVVDQDEPTSRLQSTRSFLIGAAVITAAYMMPFIGIMVWALTAVLGLGAASVAFIRAFRRENPPSPKVRREVPPVPPSVVPPVAVYPAVSATAAPPSAPTVADADAAAHLSAAADPYVAAAPGPTFAAPPPVTGHVPPAAAGVTPDPRALLAYPHADFGVRVAAFLLDVLLVSLIGGLLGELFDAHDPGDFVALLLLSYYAIFWAMKATTVGGIICQLRIVRVDGQPLRPIDAVVRTFMSVLSVAAFGLGMLWVLYDPEKQSWQDKVAGTYVVRVPRNYPL